MHEKADISYIKEDDLSGEDSSFPYIYRKCSDASHRLSRVASTAQLLLHLS